MIRSLPASDPESAPYWVGAASGRLEMQRCGACGEVAFYPRARCPTCRSDALRWETMIGLGHVYSFTIVHRAPDVALADSVPYVVALVDIDEGARMMTNIVGCPPGSVRIGMRVEVRFEPTSERGALPLFGPIADG